MILTNKSKKQLIDKIVESYHLIYKEVGRPNPIKKELEFKNSLYKKFKVKRDKINYHYELKYKGYCVHQVGSFKNRFLLYWHCLRKYKTLFVKITRIDKYGCDTLF